MKPYKMLNYQKRGLPCWLSGKESACQCRRHELDLWSGKISHAVEQLSQCASTIESVLRSLRAATMEADAPLSPCSTRREVTARTSSCTAKKRSPLNSETRKPERSNKEPVLPEVNFFKKQEKRTTWAFRKSGPSPSHHQAPGTILDVLCTPCCACITE